MFKVYHIEFEHPVEVSPSNAAHAGEINKNVASKRMSPYCTVCRGAGGGGGG